MNIIPNYYIIAMPFNFNFNKDINFSTVDDYCKPFTTGSKRQLRGDAQQLRVSSVCSASPGPSVAHLTDMKLQQL